MNEKIIRISKDSLYRCMIFRVSFHVLKEMASFNRDDILVDHKRAQELLRAIYKDLPEDLYVNRIDTLPGYACLEIVASSKSFAPVKNYAPIPEYVGYK